MKLILIFLSGSLFGFGLTLSGMLDPSKVQAIEVYQDANPHHSPQPGLGYGNPFAFGGQHYNPYLNY